MTGVAGIEIDEASVEAVSGWREEYRREMDNQIVHDSWHARGFARSWLVRARGEPIGYGSVGGPPREAQDIVKEFYLQPAHRGNALPIFRRLAAHAEARRIEAQTNDRLLLLMLYDCATNITSDTIIFADGTATALRPPVAGLKFRRMAETDVQRVFTHVREPVGEWGLDHAGEMLATGGLAFHYNPPYADIHMEVDSRHHRLGMGSYLVQELKRLAYAMGFVPGARCNVANIGSRRTLERAGMFPTARILKGSLVPDAAGPGQPAS